MVVLTFTDLRTRQTFKTSKFKIRTIKTKGGTRKQAVATAPSGGKSVRFVANDFRK